MRPSSSLPRSGTSPEIPRSSDRQNTSMDADDSRDSLRGLLLVASPALQDPNFRRAVVLVAEHGEGGAMGLVLNRPAEALAAEAVPPLAGLVDPDSHVFAGGPVEPQAVIVLAEFEDPDDAAAIVFADIGFVSGDSDPEMISSSTGRTRLFAGYAGWGTGQLESELAEDAWIVAEPLADDVFSSEPHGLWSEVLRRQGGRFALVATMPPDPSLN
jgi:putative transcriptional regulator